MAKRKTTKKKTTKKTRQVTKAPISIRIVSPQERMARPVLSGFASSNRPSDLAITSGLKNIENQQQEFQKALEEQKKIEEQNRIQLKGGLYRIARQVELLEGEREGMRRMRNVETGSESLFAPSSGDAASSAPSELLIGDATTNTQRNIDRWVEQQIIQKQRDPRREDLTVSNLRQLSEPSDDDFVAGEDIVASLDQTDANLARLDEIMSRLEASRIDPRRQ
jgi:hypothetical protein